MAYFNCFFSILVALLSFYCGSVRAQLCSGSLGDPVVNLTFGKSGNISGGGFAPPNSYQYTPSTCPNDGFYTITPATAGCFGNNWHTVNADHTGDGNGNFMLVNASLAPSDFFLQTVTDLCPNTTYEFAAWLLNVLVPNGIKPDITFTIEAPSGNILATYSTGNIPESALPQWTKYGMYFTTPPSNATIVLRMKNNAPGGNGNDIALDDITFRPCGPIIRSEIRGFSNEIDLCLGDANDFTFDGDVGSGYALPYYQWQKSLDTGKVWLDIPGANSATYPSEVLSKAGIYLYRLSVTELSSASVLSCRIVSNDLQVHMHDLPIVNAGKDRILFKGDTLHLSGIVTGESPTYFWDPPTGLNDAKLLSAVASPEVETIYTLFAESVFGCKSDDQVNIKVVADIFVPTAFSPNGDGRNDSWQIPFLDPALGATVSVYNRNGQKVYETSHAWVNWDGKVGGELQPSGVFVYIIQFPKGRPMKKGTFLLIR